VQAIVAQGTPAALAAKGATSTIPIVFEVGTDPPGMGATSHIIRGHVGSIARGINTWRSACPSIPDR
jgi:hypothetical protein